MMNKHHENIVQNRKYKFISKNKFYAIRKISLGIGLILFSSLATILGFPQFIKWQIIKNSCLINGTERWEAWRSIPIPLYFKVYVFNITNPVEVENGGKPSVQEIGPFVYLHLIEKIVENFDEQTSRIKYKNQEKFIFQEHLSSSNIKYEIYALNLPLLGAIAKMEEEASFIKYATAMVLNDEFPDEKLLKRVQIKELLFDGYFVPFVKYFEELIGKSVLPDNKFGIFYKKNGSMSPTYEIEAGIEKPLELGRILSYNRTSHFPKIWRKDHSNVCNEIKGTDGPTFFPLLNKTSVINSFIPTVCRSFPFIFDKEIENHGIPGYKFIISEKFLKDYRNYSANECYCIEGFGGHKECPLDGILQLDTCTGVPLAMSYPHFYNAHLSYVNQIDGLHASSEDHESFIEVEPRSGLPLKARIRTQINYQLKPSKYFQAARKAPKLIFPIFWTEIAADMDEEGGNFLKLRLVTSRIVSLYLMSILIVIGICTILHTLYKINIQRRIDLIVISEEYNPMFNHKEYK